MADHTDASWQPSASLQQIRNRARMLTRLRAFFHQRGVMEVQTPVLSFAANPDPAIESFSSIYSGEGVASPVNCYLQTSPEFAMKRLLAAGSGPIYQVASVFRQGEAGSRHNPEFCMLEWYRPGLDHHALMREVDALVRELAEESEWSLAETVYISYQQLFMEQLHIDPLQCSVGELGNVVRQQGISVSDLGEDRDAWLDLLMSHCIEPALHKDRPVFVYDYPASQAALARIRHDEYPVAERFELYLGGVELANGFHELWDGEEQRQRFEANNRVRAQRGLPVLPVDEHLLAALSESDVAVSGVALGLDRLQIVLSGAKHISDVMCFDFFRA